MVILRRVAKGIAALKVPGWPDVSLSKVWVIANYGDPARLTRYCRPPGWPSVRMLAVTRSICTYGDPIPSDQKYRNRREQDIVQLLEN